MALIDIAEAGQILAEAEAIKGAPLTQAELRTLMMAHLDAYVPDWSFHRRGISNEWMRGWEHAFALYARQIMHMGDSEPLHGTGLVSNSRPSFSEQTTQPQPRTTVQFRRARLLVTHPDAFWQDVQNACYELRSALAPDLRLVL